MLIGVEQTILESYKKIIVFKLKQNPEMLYVIKTIKACL